MMTRLQATTFFLAHSLQNSSMKTAAYPMDPGITEIPGRASGGHGYRLPLLLALFFLLCFSSAPVLADDSGGCLASGCHESLQNNAAGHPEKVACGSCHAQKESAVSDHPAATGAVSGKRCTACHTMDSRFMHPPAAAGDCTVCHRLHGASEKLLITDRQILCMQCHLDFDRGEKASYHPGGNACEDCHAAHGADQQNLLVAPFNPAAYLAFDVENYKLCFKCHKISLLQFPDTSFYTDFRNGRKNLHYLHVNKKNRGRNCLLCHDVHGSTSPKLIAETVSYGQWAMPLNFRKEENGGSCFPGCHGQKRYDRSIQAVPGSQTPSPPAGR